MSPAVTFPSIPLAMVLSPAVLGLTNLGVQLWLQMASSSGIASQIAGWLENQFGAWFVCHHVPVCVCGHSQGQAGIQALYWVTF